MKSDDKDRPKRKESLADDDIDLFRRAMSDTKPLGKTVKEPVRPRVPAELLIGISPAAEKGAHTGIIVVCIWI